MEKMYAKFIEHNEWEGETWCFYIPVKDNEKALVMLKEYCDTNNEYSLEAGFYLDEAEVDTLVKHGGSGYMNYHNKLTGVFDCVALREGMKVEDNTPFYKGGIADYFV